MGKILFKGVSAVADEDVEQNKITNRGRGLPLGAASCALAVVGGAPSVIDYLDELREFDGEIWGINGTHKWLKSHGIDNVFYSIDPHPELVPEYANGAEVAMLADMVDPKCFDVVGKAYVAELGPDKILNYTTSAATAPMIAAVRGHKHVTFYGCDGSYSGDASHVNKNTEFNKVWVECGGKEYVTCPGMIMQTESIFGMANHFPQYITVKGDGFLSALIKEKDYNVTHVSPAINEALQDAQNLR